MQEQRNKAECLWSWMKDGLVGGVKGVVRQGGHREVGIVSPFSEVVKNIVPLW